MSSQHACILPLRQVMLMVTSSNVVRDEGEGVLVQGEDVAGESPFLRRVVGLVGKKPWREHGAWRVLARMVVPRSNRRDLGVERSVGLNDQKETV